MINSIRNIVQTNTININNKRPAEFKPGINRRVMDSISFGSGKADQIKVFKLNNDPNSSLSRLNQLTQFQKEQNIVDIAKCNTRTTGLSKYLKKMINFIPPGSNNGDEWFQHGCTFLIKGASGINLPEQEYSKYAKELWSLIASNDSYWTDDRFLNYLSNLNQDPGVKATIKALKEIKAEKISTNSLTSITFGGYSTALLENPNLKGSTCPYTNEKFESRGSIEHLLPLNMGGDIANTDYNFIVTSIKGNSLRGDIPLVEFLRGWDADDYQKAFPDWKTILINELIEKHNISDDDIFPYYEYTTSIKTDSRPNKYLREELENTSNYSIHNLDRAEKRIKSLSNYLLKMVGFVPPDGEKDWFANATKNIIMGSAGSKNITREIFPEYAKKFWGLMAMADSYWVSDNFINYLDSLNDKKNKGLEPTIKALKAIKKELSENQISFTGNRSDLRMVKELLKSCAYSGDEMSLYKDQDLYPTVEHINPKLARGASNSYNYILTLKEPNNCRAHIPLIDYLCGWNADEFFEAKPNWKEDVNKTMQKLHKVKKQAKS